MPTCISSYQQRKGNRLIYGQRASDGTIFFFDVVQTLTRMALLNIRMGKCGGEQGRGRGLEN